jgi:ribosome-associated toxin RatA of RatAB toxin-antitoxin module
MTTFETSIEIDASPQRVWQVMSDVEKWHEWTASIRRIEILTPKPLAVGGQARVEQPKLSPTFWTVTDWQPNRGFAWESRSLGLRSLGEHWIEPTQSGSRVILRLRFTGLISFAVGWMAGKLINDYMRLEAEGLKKRSENP